MPVRQLDVAVVGLGIVGACAAHAAARAGARVAAFDAGIAGDGTSGTSFAWLNSVRKEPEHYHRLNADGMAAHVELARELGADAGYHGGGSLEWADGEEEERELLARVERLARRGYPAEWIGRERVRAMEPALAIPEHIEQIVFYAADGWLDAPRLIRTLLAAASARGAQIRERAPVQSLRARGRRVEALVVGGAEIAAGAVLICVGPATEAVLAALGVRMPVGRVPGLLALTSPPAEPLRRVVHAPGVHLRPDAGGGLLLGADDVDAPAAAAEAPSRLDELAARLLERAARVMPAARGVKIVDRRVGVRPMPADRQTIAGRIPGFDNAWLIATHSGVTLGPLLGRLIAEEIVGGTAHATLAPFRPERFGAVS
jgi:glycine/D-amino acid oxidase-like deaminating enzyme